MKAKSKLKRLDNRKYARIKADLDVRFVIVGVDPEDNMSSRVIQSETRSISVKGACIGTNIVQVDGLHICSSISGLGKNKLRLEIDLPSSSKPITPMGEVRWYNLTPNDGKYLYYVGLSFTELSNEDKETLKCFIAKEKKGDKTHFSFIRDWF